MEQSQKRVQFDARLKERHGQTPQVDHLELAERELGDGAVEYQVSRAGMRNLFKALARESDRKKREVL